MEAGARRPPVSIFRGTIAGKAMPASSRTTPQPPPPRARLAGIAQDLPCAASSVKVRVSSVTTEPFGTLFVRCLPARIKWRCVTQTTAGAGCRTFTTGLRSRCSVCYHQCSPRTTGDRRPRQDRRKRTGASPQHLRLGFWLHNDVPGCAPDPCEGSATASTMLPSQSRESRHPQIHEPRPPSRRVHSPRAVLNKVRAQVPTPSCRFIEKLEKRVGPV